jgi:hypothetical protein
MEGPRGVIRGAVRFMARTLGVSVVVYVWLDILSAGVLVRVLGVAFESSQEKLERLILRLVERESAPRGPD